MADPSGYVLRQKPWPCLFAWEEFGSVELSPGLRAEIILQREEPAMPDTIKVAVAGVYLFGKETLQHPAPLVVLEGTRDEIVAQFAEALDKALNVPKMLDNHPSCEITLAVGEMPPNVRFGTPAMPTA